MANYHFGGVNRKALGRHGGYVNAKAYGAKADDSYDNFGIIQTLATALASQEEGGTILFPGTHGDGNRYRFTEGVVVPATHTVSFIGTGHSGMTCSGEQGGDQNRLWLDSTADDAFLIKFASTSSDRARGARIENLNLVGNQNTGVLGANQSGVIFAGRCGGHYLHNLGFQNFSGYAIAHDPTVPESYNQNGTMQNVHFHNVGGCWGPTEEYVAASAYYFGTIFEWQNIALDNGILWAGSGHTPKPFYFDLRATRAVVCSQMNIEGAGFAGQTAYFGFMTGGWWDLKAMYNEIVSNRPDYLLALYGRTTAVGADGQKYVNIGTLMQTYTDIPIWFEDDPANESVVKIDKLICAAETSITQMVEFENGVDVNKSGRVEIGWAENLSLNAEGGVARNYYGRVMLKSSGQNQQSRMPLSQGRALCLMKWNANQGPIFGDWGNVRVTNAGHIASHAIEADGNFLVHRFTGGTTANHPRVRFTVLGDDFEGAVASIAYKYRCVVDAADAALNIDFYTDGNHFTDALSRVGNLQKNTSGYVVGSMQGLMMSDVSDPNRWAEFRPQTSNFSVATVMYLAAVEVWLGEPDYFELAPAMTKYETATGTFTCSLGKEITQLNSSAGAVTATLPDGVDDGQRKKVTMIDASNSSTLSVTSHETSNPEVFTFDNVNDSLILEWDAPNAFWWTVKNLGVAT